MKMIRLISLAGVFGTLVSCNSFNRYELRDDAYQKLLKEQLELHQNAPATSVVAESQITCGIYKPPVLPEPPELPMDALSKIAPSDNAGLDAIQEKHIAELRMYILTSAASERKAYRDYIQTCHPAPPH